MLQSMIKKMMGQGGETLIEALVAILVSSLAILMLATAISTSRNIIVSSKTAMETYCLEETALASRSSAANGGNVSITISFSGIDSSVSGVTISDVPSYEAHVGSQSVVAYGVSKS